MLCACHRRSRRRGNALMAQADAKSRHGGAEPMNHVAGERIPLRHSWARREDDSLRRQCPDLGNARRANPQYSGFSAQLLHIPGQRGDKGIIMIEQDDHAVATAASNAPALSSVSVYSCSGSDCAVIAPPAWIVATPRASTIVRITMLVSIAPSSPIHPIDPEYTP